MIEGSNSLELQGKVYEITELQKITEEIYELETKKNDLELALQSEKFHSQYIPKRKDVLLSKFWIQIVIIVAIMAFFVWSLGSTVLWIFLDGFLFFILVRIVWDEIKLFRILFGSKKSTSTVTYNEQYNMPNIHHDKEISNERIDALKEQISGVENRIEQLKLIKNSLLEEVRSRDDFLRNQGILFDKNPNEENKNSKFTLSQESIAMGEIQDLIEFYDKEEKYTKLFLSQVNVELDQINKKIIQIDEDFEAFKKTAFLSVLIFILIVIIEAFIPGALGFAADIICSVATFVAFLILESKYKNSIILYLIEHDNSLIQEYAFRYNMVPVYIHRNDLLEKIQGIQKELNEIQNKKAELVLQQS